MKKNVPAVFYQNQLNGPTPAGPKPEALELFENQLRAVVGGATGQPGSRFYTTYSGSEGWLDVEQGDDTHI